jgi:hypothetical protein
LALLQDVQLGTASQGSAFIDQEQWSVTRWDRAGAIQIKSIRVKGVSWSPQQAAGAPDTPTVGDQTSAWASQSSDGGTEWLILQYARAVVPRQVEVYESCGPGALFRVTVFDDGDREIEAWSGADPTPATPAASSGATVPVSTIPVSLNVSTRKIKIYLACDKVPGWNEIDAVGLVSDKGERQWARQVQASSTYASSFGSNSGNSGGNPQLLVPGWSRLDAPGRAMESGLANREERQVDARGWPMVALMSEVDTLATGAINSAAVPRANSYTTVRTGRVGSGSFAVATPSAGHAPIPIPLRPVWIGLVGDTLIFATFWFAFWSTLVIPRRFIREVARFRRGACIECGYDLGYDFIQGCPECGWRRERQQQGPTRPER